MYAQITDNTITDRRRTLPDTARRLDTGDTVLGFPSADADTIAACGWYEVAETAEPVHDATTQHPPRRTIEVVDGLPTVVWTVSDLTPDELAAKARAATDEVERDAARDAYDNLGTFLGLDSPTAAQVVGQVKLQARVLRRLIRDTYGDAQ